jgi:hypothetical protein
MDFPDNDILAMREELIDSIKEIIGHEPPGIRVLLRVLSHPSVVAETNRYFTGVDTSNKCLRYEAPWSCGKESEANYENIKYGWLGGASGIGFDESWCSSCRRKVLGDEA